MRLILDIDGPDLEYFLACARIRDISPTTLGRRLIAAICADLLVVSVLDDGDNYRSRSKGEHKYETPKRAKTPVHH